MRTKAFIGVLAMSGILAVPSAGFTQQYRNDRDNHWYDNLFDRWNDHHNDDYRQVRDLQGRWYLNGDRDKPTEIDRDNGRLQATNENGQTTRLDVDRYGNVIADDWHDLRGNVRGNRIEWENGTTWTRSPSERIGSRYDRNDNYYDRWNNNYGYNDNYREVRDLQGRWYLNGDRDKPTEIDRENGRLQATNENGQTTRLEVNRYGNVIAYDWHGLRGDVRGSRIEWDNGTTWTRRPTENIGRR